MSDTATLTQPIPPIPDPVHVDAWLEACAGDTYAALLCATAALAAQRYEETVMAARRGEVTTRATARWAAMRADCRADVANYYGATLDAQHAAVRAAGGAQRLGPAGGRAWPPLPGEMPGRNTGQWSTCHPTRLAVTPARSPFDTSGARPCAECSQHP